MRNRTRVLIVGLGAAVLTSAAAGAPSLLRRFDSFAVQNVEIRGTRYLPAYDALKQSGIGRRSSVFDDFAPWRARLLKNPLILDAQIERRLPATIRISVTETTPVALAQTPDLTPVDARGKALPIDPAAFDLDLPILSQQSHPNAHGDFVDAQTRATVAALSAIQQNDPRLYSWVSEAGALQDEGVRLSLRSGAEALVSAAPTSQGLHELEVALADLAVRGELPQLKRIDARYHDQVVVALKNGN